MTDLEQVPPMDEIARMAIADFKGAVAKLEVEIKRFKRLADAIVRDGIESNYRGVAWRELTAMLNEGRPNDA